MPKRLIKRFLPDHNTIRNHKHLKCLGRLLHDPNIWHLNRRSVAGAFSVGLFVAFIPIPFQMLVAAVTAIPLRVNLPISVGLVWITNPITMPPVFYTCYKFGTWLLSTPPLPNLDFSLEGLGAEFAAVGPPLILGSLTIGAILALLSNVVVRLLWRMQIVKYLRRRRSRRRTGSAANLPPTKL